MSISNWFWQRVTQHLRASLTVELVGITEDALVQALRSEAMRRLGEVEGILFSEEIGDKEKLSTLQACFLREE